MFVFHHFTVIMTMTKAMVMMMVKVRYHNDAGVFHTG